MMPAVDRALSDPFYFRLASKMGGNQVPHGQVFDQYLTPDGTDMRTFGKAFDG